MSTASPVALAQRRQSQADLGQTVVEVLAEPALPHQLVQVTMGRADDADVDRDLLAPADPLDHPLLQEAQQLGLQPERQVADLVEEQRCRRSACSMRARRLLDRAGEGAALVAEQLGFEQRLGDRRAVDRRRTLGPARAGGVQRPGATSLPVPLSPPMITLTSVGATRSI